MAGILVPSAVTVPLRPQRGDADASWPVGRDERKGQSYRLRRVGLRKEMMHAFNLMFKNPHRPILC